MGPCPPPPFTFIPAVPLAIPAPAPVPGLVGPVGLDAGVGTDAGFGVGDSSFRLTPAFTVGAVVEGVDSEAGGAVVGPEVEVDADAGVDVDAGAAGVFVTVGADAGAGVVADVEIVAVEDAGPGTDGFALGPAFVAGGFIPPAPAPADGFPPFTP